MNDDSDIGERTSVDLFLFALGFIGFLCGVTGAILASPALAIFGGLIFLGSIASFSLWPPPGE